MLTSHTLLVASTVATERSFSRGRILLSHLRNRLRATTVRALMCFGDWCRLGLVREHDLVEVVSGRNTTADAPITQATEYNFLVNFNDVD